MSCHGTRIIHLEHCRNCDHMTLIRWECGCVDYRRPSDHNQECSDCQPVKSTLRHLAFITDRRCLEAASAQIYRELKGKVAA